MELFHFRVQWNARNISCATLRECGEASSCQEANPMYEETNDSCLPARSCQEANSMYEEADDSLSEGKLESTWPCSIQKYCRVQRNRDFIPVQWGRWGRLTIKRCGRGSSGRLYGRGTNPCITCWKVPYIGPGRGKPDECYKHQWGKVRQASQWGPWKFRPPTEYGAFPPYTQWFITSSWPLGG